MSRSILIIKLGALGDVILASPHIVRIIEAHPDVHIWLLTAPEYVSLFAGCSRLRTVAFPRKGMLAMGQAMHWVRKQHFRVIYDLQGSDRVRLLTLVSGAEQRIGLGPGWLYTHRPVDDECRNHIFDRLNGLLACAGVPKAVPTPRLWTEPSSAAAVSRWLESRQLQNAAIVLMHAGSSPGWPSKRWEEGHFAQLATLLVDAGLPVIWTGGDVDREINRRLAAITGMDATGQFTVAELAALAQSARFAVVNDSAPMHILSTAGIPVYALFGPTDWRRSHALGQEVRVLRNPVSCSPCHLGECPPAQQHRCLAGITPGEVFARLQADHLV
jgi:ADP-heptose:LPS heptosyltransferase